MFRGGNATYTLDSKQIIIRFRICRYKEGMLQARGEDKGLNTLVEDAADGLMAQLETKGPESVDDWEVDELLQWTSGLNFEE